MLLEEFTQPKWKSLLEENSLVHFDDWWKRDLQAVEEKNTGRGGWSQVYRLFCGESVFYVKRQHNHCARSMNRGFQNVPTFKREYDNIHWFQNAGIPTLSCVYFAWKRQGDNHDAILVTESLQEYSSLNEMEGFKFLSDQQKLGLASAIGKSIRKMHDAGIRHCNLYPKHVFVKYELDSWAVRFIDLETSRRNLSLRYLKLRDIETLTRRTRFGSEEVRIQVLLSYLNKTAIDQEVRWWIENIRARSDRKFKKKAAQA